LLDGDFRRRREGAGPGSRRIELEIDDREVIALARLRARNSGTEEEDWRVGNDRDRSALVGRPLERQRLSDDELDVIDLVMLDIKTWDPERHKRLTGMDVEPTLEFARRLAARKRRCGFAMFSSQA
jgi:hypothetical protein